MTADDPRGNIPLAQRLALLSGVPTFAALPPDALAALAGQLREESVPAGAVIVRQGEVGDRFYLITAGQAEVSVVSPDGSLPLATLGPGESFGEIALLRPDARRTATVAALGPMTLLSLRRDALDRLVAAHPAVRDALDAGAEATLIAQFLKQASPFAALDDTRRRALAARLRSIPLDAGVVIVRQGDGGDACYLLRRGEVEVVREAAGEERRVATLQAGALFGEAALLADTPRTATVRTIAPCELLVLHRADLLTALQADAAVGERLRDLLQMRDRVARVPGVEAHHRETPSGEIITTLKDPRRGAYYRLSPQGWFIWGRLDGERTLRDLTMDYLREYRAFAPQAIADVVAGLAGAGFAAGVGQRLRADAQSPGAMPSRGQRAMRRARRAMEWYLPLRGVDGALTRLYRGGVRFLYTRPAQALLALVAVAGLVAFVLARGRVHAALVETKAGGSLLLFLIPAYALATLLHEAGHAFTTKAFGREVSSVGIGWYWLSPVAYVDTSDMWLAGRWPRIAVNLAGVHTNAVLAGGAALGAWLSPNLVAAALLWQFALSSYAMILLNLNPLLELDGYFVLIDALERPNLRPRALAWLGRRLVPTLRKEGAAGLRGHALEIGYGAAALAYLAVEVWLSVALYRLLVVGWLGKVLPVGVAAGLGWALAAGVVALTALGMAGDLRGARSPIGTR